MTRRRALTDDQVREIRASYHPGKRGSGYLALSKKYGVGASTIRDLILYRTIFSARIK